MPDYVISQLASMLQQGSMIRDDPQYRPPSPASPDMVSHKVSYDFNETDKIGQYTPVEGTTELGRFLPRERFSYWCFDLLFLICSDVVQGGCLVSSGEVSTDNITDRIPRRKRVAALSIPSLLKRCKSTILNFIADEALRGNLPFPRRVKTASQLKASAHTLLFRAREEELLYVLRGLLQLRLWPGTLWAAFSSDPSKYSSDQPREPIFSHIQTVR